MGGLFSYLIHFDPVLCIGTDDENGNGEVRHSPPPAADPVIVEVENDDDNGVKAQTSEEANDDKSNELKPPEIEVSFSLCSRRTVFLFSSQLRLFF